MSDDGAAIPAEPTEQDWPPPLPHGLRNYILWHWRGWLPLGLSFWFSIVFLNFLLGLAKLAYLYIAPEMPEYRSLPVVITVVQPVAALLLLIWQIVGTCRAAYNHYQSTGGWIWPSVTILFIIVAFLYALSKVTGW